MWAHCLVMANARSQATMFAAMRRASEKHSIPHGTLWTLRYRPPKSIGGEDYFAISNAYPAERSDAEARIKVGAALLSVADEIRKAPSSRA
jgi:hypothetical protein